MQKLALSSSSSSSRIQSQRALDGPDEDEHYEVREMGHPNKTFRKMDTGFGKKATKRSQAGNSSSMANPLKSTLTQSQTRSGTKSAIVVGRRPPGSALNGIGNASSAAQDSDLPIEVHIRNSKDHAIEMLHLLDKESLLDRDIDLYIQDVESSYNEASMSKLAFPKHRAAWTREEDRLLTIGVRVYGPNTESWPRIAMLVPGRTNKSCRKRWFHSLDPSLHKGPWTPEEDELLRKRVSEFPSQWSRVAEGIPGRTDDQCAKRWRESLDPDIDRGKWRPEEDLLLLEKYAEFGTQWQKIATFFQGRPGLHCRNRWRKIQRIIKQNEKKTGSTLTKADIASTLATVTESVNKRKTAHRSRSNTGKQDSSSQNISDTLVQQASNQQTLESEQELHTNKDYSAQKECLDETPDCISPFSIPSTSVTDSNTDNQDIPRIIDPTTSTSGQFVFDNSHQQLGTLQQAQNTLNHTLLSHKIAIHNNIAQHSPISTSAFSTSTNVADSAHQQIQNQQLHTSLYDDAHQRFTMARHGTSGTSDSLGALYIPSEYSEGHHQQLPTAFMHKGASGAKRSASVLFSPTDEQRQRVKKLGLRLYGCAAAPELCSAAFSDALSLNTHIKLSHPAIARLIPSLNYSSHSGPSSTALDTPPSLPLDTTPMTEMGDAFRNDLTLFGFGGEGSDSTSNRGHMLKPYRCAMNGCQHQYKNINGLEYHIFHSRKSNSHLLLPSWPSDGSGKEQDSSAGTPDTTAGAEYMPLGDNSGFIDSGFAGGFADSLSNYGYSENKNEQAQLSGTAASGELAAAANNSITFSQQQQQPRFQCPEVDCLANFTTEAELRGHVAMNHPRPIRRAYKPSSRVKGAVRNISSSARDQQMARHPYWNADVLSGILTSVANIEAGNPSVANNTSITHPLVSVNTPPRGNASQHMPTIHEAGIQNCSEPAAAAAIAAAMGLGNRRTMHPTLNIASPILHQNHNTLNAFASSSPSFMSAPALISATGGEPTDINSYFTLGLRGHEQPFILNQQRQNQDQLPRQHNYQPIRHSPLIGKAINDCGDNNIKDNGVLKTRINNTSDLGDKNMASNLLRQMAMTENMTLDLQMVQNMLNPIYNSSIKGTESLSAQQDTVSLASKKFSIDTDGDVSMDNPKNVNNNNDSNDNTIARSHRSDSIDLSSLATVPPDNDKTQADSHDTDKGNDDRTPSPQYQKDYPFGMASFNNEHTLSELGDNKQAQQAMHIPQQQIITQLQQQQLFNPIMAGPATISVGNNIDTEIQRHLLQAYPFPTPATMAEAVAVAAGANPNPSISGGNAVRCLNPGCNQVFNDAYTLKHHMNFDHPRDGRMEYRSSYPDSPVDNIAAATTIPPISQSIGESKAVNAANNEIKKTDPLIFSMPLPSQPSEVNAMTIDQVQESNTDNSRTRAPHWVDQNLWSSWIAAANGNGDIMSMAAATAMGITPGVTGPPHPQTSQVYFEQPHSDHDLLRMLDTLPTDGEHLPLDQQIAIAAADSMLVNEANRDQHHPQMHRSSSMNDTPSIHRSL